MLNRKAEASAQLIILKNGQNGTRTIYQISFFLNQTWTWYQFGWKNKHTIPTATATRFYLLNLAIEMHLLESFQKPDNWNGENFQLSSFIHFHTPIKSTIFFSNTFTILLCVSTFSTLPFCFKFVSAKNSVRSKLKAASSPSRKTQICTTFRLQLKLKRFSLLLYNFLQLVSYSL